MKKTSKLYQTVSVITLCFLMLSFLFGCSMLNVDMDNLNFENQDAETDEKNSSIENKDDVNNDQNVKDDDKNTEEKNDESLHVHEFKLEFDETGHFSKCECGEITDLVSHTLDWVIDQEPTYTAPGYKHQECSACGYKTAENTVINIVLDVPGIDPTPITAKKFVSFEDLTFFCEENKEKIGKSFLCLKAVSNSEDGIYVVNEWMELTKYYFIYDDENEESFVNPYIRADFQIYSSELGTDTDIAMDVPLHSFTIEFISNGCNSYSNDLRFEFMDCSESDSTWERIVYIYDENELAGEAYLSFSLDISNDWLIDYLKDYLFVL